MPLLFMLHLQGAALTAAIDHALGLEGPFAQSQANFKPREGQQQLARAVGDALTESGTLVAEAGTGVGKTYAYLVPLLLSGGKALVSTATKSLQDQLFHRDIPRLREMLSRPVRVALLKGRASYLCVHRMQQARHEYLPDRHSGRVLERIEWWSQQTRSGDLSELEGLDERSPLIPFVTSNRDNCLGKDCPSYARCHVIQARREAMEADLVVINHHLFFADLRVKDSGVAELLPSVDALVFDEAHQLNSAGTSFLGEQLSSHQWDELAEDVVRTGLQTARTAQPWLAWKDRLQAAGRAFTLACHGPLRDVRASLRVEWSERDGRADFEAALDGWEELTGELLDVLTVLEPQSADWAKLKQRMGAWRASMARMRMPVNPDRVRWVEVTARHAKLCDSPLDIRHSLDEQRAQSGRAWIFVSATLGDASGMKWFCEPAGLEDARQLRASSPFEYERLARLYVPRGFPKPAEAEAHAKAVAHLSARLAHALDGRTFVLTTTVKAIQTLSELMRPFFEARESEGSAPMLLLKQGDAPKRRLLEQFLEAPRAVLVGSHSFWEGIDVPGDALQCVVIDKLPFPPPNDPVLKAQSDRLVTRGQDPFEALFLTEAAVALQQGAGRLIRSEEDHGLLVITDPRLSNAGYGRKLLASLPPMPRLESEDEVRQWLKCLRRLHREKTEVGRMNVGVGITAGMAP